MGRDDYIVGSRNHFHRNSFVVNGIESPYFNPRRGDQNFGGHPQQSDFHWTHIPINLIINRGFGLLGYL